MTDKELYRRLCQQQTDLPLFLYDWWLDVVCAEWDVAVVKNGDNIAGVWPYAIEHKIGVQILRNPVLTPYLSPFVFYPADLKPTKRDNFEHEIIAALYAKMPAAKVWKLSLLPGQKQVGFFKAKGFELQPRQTFLMPLREDEATIFSRLHEDYRRNIRKAEAEMQITHEPEMLPALWRYQKATLERKEVNMYFTQLQMQNLFDNCIQHAATSLWVARKAGVVQAILWHVWDNNRAYYLVGSKNPEIKDNRAVTALIWHAIKESNRLGKASFDFEGSMDPGVEHFFRNFGGERTLYMMLRKNTSLLWKLKELVRP